MADYIIEKRIQEGVTWLFVEIPGAIVRDSNRPDAIQPCLGGVKMRVGERPSKTTPREWRAAQEQAIWFMEEYLSHLPDFDPDDDDRDTHIIKGYAVYERTAKPRGNSGMLQVPASDIGKRFKIVRVDP